MTPLETKRAYLEHHPDQFGFYGDFGGAHYPERMQPELDALTRAHHEARRSPEFQHRLHEARVYFQGRPTPVSRLANLSEEIGGATIYVKREDLNHTGAHKLNHCVGFALLAKHMGKSKLIAETGAGQHGVALAAAAAYFGLTCEVHMGRVDAEKSGSNINRMRILGAEVVVVDQGQSALKEASDSALNAYHAQAGSALYAIGSAIGPHPFPMIVRDFQSIVGREAKAQFAELAGRDLPDNVVACVAGGSNSMGIYAGFLDDPSVALHGVEPLGKTGRPGEHAATLTFGRPGQLHGADCLVLHDEDGNVAKVSSVASGLVYPGVGPEICMLYHSGRLSVVGVDDERAVEAFHKLSQTEGIIPALESAHALSFAMKLAAERPCTENILINLSGRGDKDVDYVAEKYPRHSA